MSRHILLLLVTWILLVILACRAQPTAPAPEASAGPASTSVSTLPRTEAEVPRVSLEEARAAVESGEAIVVDVRSAEAYATSHVAGAIHIDLNEIEANPADLDLDKDQWIITYCT
jgi:3-mercaptopyruvate sulfurtransferase SseA